MIYPYNTLIVVDDNAAILTALKICLATEFEHIITMTSPDNLVSTIAKEQSVDAVLLDMNFSLGVNTGQDGLFWLRTIKKLHPNTPVILITAYADVQLAVKGLKYAVGQRQAHSHPARRHRQEPRGYAARTNGARTRTTCRGTMSR